MTSGFSDLSEAKRTIRDRIIALAAKRGVDACTLKDEDVLLESGTLDSVALLELMMWIEMTFDLTIAQSDLTVDNFGTIDAVATYLQRAR